MPLKQTLENTQTTLEKCKQAEKDSVESAGIDRAIDELSQLSISALEFESCLYW